MLYFLIIPFKSVINLCVDYNSPDLNIEILIDFYLYSVKDFVKPKIDYSYSDRILISNFVVDENYDESNMFGTIRILTESK